MVQQSDTQNPKRGSIAGKENDWGAGNSSVCHKAGTCWVWGHFGDILAHTQSVQKLQSQVQRNEASLSKTRPLPSRPLYLLYKLSTPYLWHNQNGFIFYLPLKKKQTFQPFLSTQVRAVKYIDKAVQLSPLPCSLLFIANLMLVCSGMGVQRWGLEIQAR